MDREKYCMGSYTIASDDALRKKVFWHANGRRLSVENFDGENADELIKICQIRQYFPPSKFCAIQYVQKYALCQCRNLLWIKVKPCT